MQRDVRSFGGDVRCDLNVPKGNNWKYGMVPGITYIPRYIRYKVT